MDRKHLLTLLALCAAPALCPAQDTGKKAASGEDPLRDNSSFTFSESQLGEDDDITSDIIQVSSAGYFYTSNIGYTWSPVRFKFRALDSRYNDVYMNGVGVNNSENGRFSYSTIGGMNDAMRGQEAATPFEDNGFSLAGLGGATDYNLRASQMPSGHKVTLSGANRNYTLRGMYTYGTGLSRKGWAFFGTVGYRWANMTTAAVEGTFYNSLAYFLSLEKVLNERHSLSLASWGNPTERAQQGASTDEAYWLANDYQYNPYWGYQNGKRRASRIVTNYEPTALLTWDYRINDRAKLTTSLMGKYVMYQSTKLNYNDAKNPAPDYWKSFPSASYDVWDEDNTQNWDYAAQAWQDSYERWTSSKAARQIDFDRLYAANRSCNAAGRDAAYYIQAKHNDQLALHLGSTLDFRLSPTLKWRAGVQLGANKGMHYQTMEDLMGARYMHNVNNYAIGAYLPTSDEAQYDLNRPGASVGEGDRFGYDYNIFVREAKAWTSVSRDKGISHTFLAAKLGGAQMWREGRMRNGICPDNSYGKSGKAGFLDGGFKAGSTLNLGRGHAVSLGVGYEARAPQAYSAFVSPEMNNDFVRDLKDEKVVSSELSYHASNSWLQLSLTGYFTHTYAGTEWQNFYFDDVNSFTYVSLSGVEKNYYGAELGARVKVTSSLDIRLLATYSEAKYNKNTDVAYMLSTQGTTERDVCHNKGMRESGTPLAAASLGLNYRVRGWYLGLTGNYYDRIYLSYSPCLRYGRNVTSTVEDPVTGQETTVSDVPGQAKGKGGFMLDASIGRQFRLAHHPLSVNLTLTNLTNNRKITTGGYEQSRSNYSTNKNGTQGNERIYDFRRSPKKYYAQGLNFMLNLNYRF